MSDCASRNCGKPPLPPHPPPYPPIDAHYNLLNEQTCVFNSATLDSPNHVAAPGNVGTSLGTYIAQYQQLCNNYHWCSQLVAHVHHIGGEIYEIGTIFLCEDHDVSTPTTDKSTFQPVNWQYRLYRKKGYTAPSPPPLPPGYAQMRDYVLVRNWVTKENGAHGECGTIATYADSNLYHEGTTEQLAENLVYDVNIDYGIGPHLAVCSADLSCGGIGISVTAIHDEAVCIVGDGSFNSIDEFTTINWPYLRQQPGKCLVANDVPATNVNNWYRKEDIRFGPNDSCGRRKIVLMKRAAWVGIGAPKADFMAYCNFDIDRSETNCRTDIDDDWCVGSEEDCGPHGHRRMQDSAVADPFVYDSPGHIELWVSRSLALFGTRAATIDTTGISDRSVTVRLTEGLDGDSAYGRYVYLRSFDSGRELRIDGVKIYGQVGATERRRRALELASSKEEAASTPKPEAKPEAKPSVERISVMRNITEQVCNSSRNGNAARANKLRLNAAHLWAELSSKEAGIGCIDCLTTRPINCTRWFMHPHGTRGDINEEVASKRRKLREQIDEQGPQRRRVLEEALGNSCCRTNKKTGERECGVKYCTKAFQEKANRRQAHILRRMHERPGKTELSVTELVATDLLTGYMHHDPECQTPDKRKKTGEMDCVASSFLNHASKKYGFDTETIDSKLKQMGMSLGEILVSHLHTASTSNELKGYKSDPAAASAAAAARSAEKVRRRMSDKPTRRRRGKGPRGDWLQRSTVEGSRRLSEEDEGSKTDVLQYNVAAQGNVLLAHRRADQWMANHTRAAKRLLKAADLGAARMGTESLSASGIVSDAFDASLTSDVSVIGRARSVFTGIQRAADKMGNLRDTLNNARATLRAAPPMPPRKKRKLTAREEAFFDAVDQATGPQQAGFKVPDHHMERWGWVSEALDWSFWWDEAHRVGRVLYERHEWMHDHAEKHGTLPTGELEDRHKTGYELLDVNAPPTRIGEWVRGKFEGGEQHRRHRKLQSRRKLSELERAAPEDGRPYKSVIGSFFEAAVNEADSIEAVREALHHNNHNTFTRRMFETASYIAEETTDKVYNYGAELAPLVFGDATGTLPGEPTAAPEVDFLRQVGRYVAYDTLACYLYPRVCHASNPSHTCIHAFDEPHLANISLCVLAQLLIFKATSLATARPFSCTTQTAPASRSSLTCRRPCPPSTTRTGSARSSCSARSNTRTRATPPPCARS